MLKLFYITNSPEIAAVVQSAGVDRIFVDMEYIGKAQRQPGMDTVQNHHTVADVRAIRRVLSTSELLVRVNPIHNGSQKEIEDTIASGADVIMLPMWKSAAEVRTFLSYVNGRAKTLLLLETEEAMSCLDEVLTLDGIDEIHIGLNDLHLAQHKRNMFELFIDGTVDSIVDKLKASGIPFGIGGVGSVAAQLTVPATLVLSEHYRLGSSMAILARAFCNTEKVTDLAEIKAVFDDGIRRNRDYERFLAQQDSAFFEQEHQKLTAILNNIGK